MAVLTRGNITLLAEKWERSGHGRPDCFQTHPQTLQERSGQKSADHDSLHMATRSRKGYWRMSQNEMVRYALNNRW